MKRLFLVSLSLIFLFVYASAQIGYQVTVYDQVKKEPKANQTVTATVTITDNAGTQIASETYTGTTDEFGILSMTVGNANSFDKVNKNNLPLWISASVDGITISKTQILTVPVAEYAKRTGTLTLDRLCGKTWKDFYTQATGSVTRTFSFSKNGTATFHHYEIYQFDPKKEPQIIESTESFSYTIDGDAVICCNDSRGYVLFYVPGRNALLNPKDPTIYN